MTTLQTPRVPPSIRSGGTPAHKSKENALEQISSFVGFFIWLLVFKGFFLPLFIIPTGSMAETLYGAHAEHVCPNCGVEFPVGFNRPPGAGFRPEFDPNFIQCPNCRWQEAYRTASGQRLRSRLYPTAGDRIVVHGWPYVFGGVLGPRRWDVVVFKNPNEPQENYIKRLVGLPGETIEIIDGDLYVNGVVERKAPHAQKALWFPYYDHNHRPRQASLDGFFPRWLAAAPDNGWNALETRSPRFDGLERAPGEIRFVTRDGGVDDVGEVRDIYGYNSTPPRNFVTDVRLGATVEFEAGTGWVELSVSKYEDVFFARLHADGRVTLEHQREGAPRAAWGEGRVALRGPVDFRLANADACVRAEVDGQTLVQSNAEQYRIAPEQARAREQLPRLPAARAPRLSIRASQVRAALRDVLIERDVHYTSDVIKPNGQRGNGVSGSPITLRADDYFVLGDNSPQSADSRYWDAPGPHLAAAYQHGAYQVGTVPGDQLIGRAFLVYWPGFMPLYPGGPNLLVNFGHIRWID